MDACPDMFFIGVVKIFAFPRIEVRDFRLELEQK